MMPSKSGVAIATHISSKGAVEATEILSRYSKDFINTVYKREKAWQIQAATPSTLWFDLIKGQAD
jgi:hypothetical protein